METCSPRWKQTTRWPTFHISYKSLSLPIQEKLSTLEAAIADATENLGESETREALLKKAEFFAQV